MKVIEYCTECANCKRKRVYTEDSWEHVEELTCDLEMKKITGYHETFDKQIPPGWCPLRKIPDGPIKEVTRI